MSKVSIAIIGAGPVGCALGRILQKSSICNLLDIVIFEAEEKIDVRSQGGTLDLREGSGLEAIKMANLWSEFQQYARYDGESLILSDKNLTKYLSMKGDEQAKTGRAPEIDRYRLRQILLQSLTNINVTFGKKLQSVQTSPDGKKQFKLQFRDGSFHDCDLVFGADGAWSKTREFLSDIRPIYSNIAGYSFTISEASKVVPELVKLIRGGNLFALDDNIMLIQQRMGDDKLNVAVYWEDSVNSDKNWHENLSFDINDVEQAKKYILQEKIKGWNSVLQSPIVSSTSQTSTTRPWSLFMLPLGFRWQGKKGITLIGDAAHLMTPFAGEGVNQGLADVSALANHLIKSLQPFKEASKDTILKESYRAIESYESELFPRMKVFMQKTSEMMRISFKIPGGLYNNIEKYILTAVEDELPLRIVFLPIISVFIHLYYFFFRRFI